MINALPLQVVCEMARNIPCAPWLLPQIMSLLKAEDSNIADVEALIKKDPGLSATALRMANTAFFSRGSPIESLNQAILRLGFKVVYKLVVTSISQRWLANDIEGYGWEPGDLYKHSLAVALSADRLARKTDWIDPETAYTAGLLHDVGKLALAYACSDAFEEIRQYQQEKQISWRQAEHDLLGYDHTDIGGTLLEGWSYPASLIEVACYYPRPSLAAEAHRPLVAIIHMAKHISLAIGIGVGEEGFATELDQDLLDELGISEEDFEAMIPEILADLEKILTSGPQPS